MLASLFLAGLIGCGDSTQHGDHSSPLDASWVGQMALDPGSFRKLVETDRNGWAAYHSGQLEKAAAQGGDVGARAHRDLAELHARLGVLGSITWTNIVATWDARTGLPKDSGITWFAALAALEAGNTDQGTQWLTMAKEVPYPPVSEAASVLSGLDLDASHLLSQNALVKRVATHAEARRTGDVSALMADATRPLLVESAAGHERPFFDPQLPWTLAVSHAISAGDLPREALSVAIFSGCPSEDSARSELRSHPSGTMGPHCATDALWKELGLDLSLGDSDDADRVRVLSREADAVLDAWKESLVARANEEGRALVEDLQLVPLLRGRMLLAQARRALQAGHPRQAQALLLVARDLSHPRDISPLNPPLLYAMLAETHLRTGHTREALDALEVLVEAFPAVVGVDETVGDLAVLQGLDRRGDSKEL
jgi:hypothetical protein